MLPWGILSSSGSGAAAAYELISSSILTGTASSITFGSIPQTYKHLEIRATLRSDRAGAESEIVTFRFNSDTGSNYATHFLSSNGSSVSSSNYSAETYMRGEAYPGGADTTNAFGAFVLQITDYTSTNKTKTQRLFSGRRGSSQYAVSLRSGLWNSTNAITTITLNNFFSSNFVSGTRVSLYGIKG